MQKLGIYTPTRFMAKTSRYDKDKADFAVNFIECLKHTKGIWAGKKFELIDWQEQIIRDLFGIIKPSKRKATEKIDGVVALIMSLSRATINSGSQESVCNERGLIFI